MTGLLRVCGHPGCTTFTLGSRCVEHEEAAPQRSWPRGRPYRRPTVPAPRVEAIPSAVRR